jgi:prevent-host-death family protein
MTCVTARRRIVKRAPDAASDQVALAELKARLSHYVRVVQRAGRPITVTSHGRVAAVLGPPPEDTVPRPDTREPLVDAPLGRIALPPPPRQKITREDLQRALDEVRSDRL